MTRNVKQPQSLDPKIISEDVVFHERHIINASDLFTPTDYRTPFHPNTNLGELQPLIVCSPKQHPYNKHDLMMSTNDQDILDETNRGENSIEEGNTNWVDHATSIEGYRPKLQETVSHSLAALHLSENDNNKFGFLSAKNMQTIIVGSTVYTLYNLVFCLAMASSITAPHRSRATMLGPIAKLCIMGVCTGSPLLLFGLSADHPALYPVFDLFLAPFFADISRIVDLIMYEQSQRTGEETVSPEKYDDNAFLTTYAFIIGIGLSLTTLANFVGSRVKLANIGEYLPYPVLCGFFSTVGVTLWTLAIAVDTGKSIQEIMSSRSWDLLWNSFLHHLPSALTGVLMYIFGPRNKLFVTVMALAVILISHALMFLCSIPLEEAQRLNWFWTAEDLKVEISVIGGKANWEPFEPFGVVYGILFSKHVNYEAVASAIPTIIAMSLVYTLRCYLFASAFRKSASEAWDYIAQKEAQPSKTLHYSAPSTTSNHRRSNSIASQVTQIGVHEEISLLKLDDSAIGLGHQVKKAAAPKVSKTLSWYNANLILLTLVGSGGPVIPGIGISPSLLKIGVEGLAPQFTSIFLMAYFYATDMSIVAFIPKMTFSSLLVLSSINMLNSWFLKSFSKIRQKEEWLAVPLIIAFYFMFDMLRAVALGVALSTFIFVASFYRTGVVKFMATGRTIQSTVARTKKNADWLNRNGDLIQIIVLQNYLFFGNASSVLCYISSMFEEISEKEKLQLNGDLPPIPKYLIVDLSLVTGIDASTADVFSEVLSLCKSHDCRLFVVGLSSAIKSALACGGFKPASFDNFFRFISNLESALGRAEDGLLTDVFRAEEKERKHSVKRRHIRLMSLGSDSGFQYALEQIDQQHEFMFAPLLLGLEKYTKPYEIEVGQSLYQNKGGVVSDDNRGLFFIETGLLRVERDSDYCTRSRCEQDFVVGQSSGQPSMKTGRSSESKISARSTNKIRKFRLARIGPGFVVGGVELSTGLQDPGIQLAVTKCRLHHLPYNKMAEVEKIEPLLMLNLYKLLAHLIACREQEAVAQLTTMHSIVGSVPDFKPKNRAMLACERASSVTQRPKEDKLKY